MKDYDDCNAFEQCVRDFFMLIIAIIMVPFYLAEDAISTLLDKLK